MPPGPPRAVERHRTLAAEQLIDGRLQVLISGEAGLELLEAIRANGRISLLFASPRTYRALRLKGRDAIVEAADDARHRGLVAQRLQAFAQQLAPCGFPLGYALALYAVPEGALTAIRFTPDGMPHVAHLPQAESIDESHIALSFQFFNTSRTHLLATRRARLSIDDRDSGASVVMQLDHLRTDCSNRKLRLAAAELRLLLLQRRLAERGGPLQIEKTGRGRFRFAVQRPLVVAD